MCNRRIKEENGGVKRNDNRVVYLDLFTYFENIYAECIFLTQFGERNRINLHFLHFFSRVSRIFCNCIPFFLHAMVNDFHFK